MFAKLTNVYTNEAPEYNKNKQQFIVTEHHSSFFQRLKIIHLNINLKD